MLKALCLILVAAVPVAYSTPAQASEADEKAAVQAAEAWLKTVDAGDYAKSWEDAATLFKGVVPKADWVPKVKGVREPLGKLLKRTVLSKTYAEELPGAPAGKYVVIQFATSYEKKNAAIETVTPMLDKDGKWHVSGYFIK